MTGLKSRGILAAVLVLAAVAAAALLSSGSRDAGKSAPSREEMIARGRYISLISACNDCHTPGTFYNAADTTRRFSGSELGWRGPWGVTFPRNITPDVETGIGSWTEEQIVTAIRTGQRPDKSPILPPMPWPMYAHLSDEDAYALAAYMKSLPPVSHRAPDRVPPGGTTDLPTLEFPPPPAWDAPRVAANATAP